ncbi:hypothetical protein DFH06DRAFT_1002060 [Mycena polygramma]|nr:hypothetical protein DFH06DRAFT_1002060 [Mycena polygramma]
MREWKLHHRMTYLERISHLEAYPAHSSICHRCKSSPGLFRCDHCIGQALWCEACCLALHQAAPFHRPKKWNGKCFKRMDLDKIGLTIFFGHGGTPCPSLPRSGDTVTTGMADPDGDINMDTLDDDGWEDEPRAGFVGDRMHFVDSTGIFSRRVRWCCCMDDLGTTVPLDWQLLDAQIYPATSRTPSTAFTFNVLDEFLIDALECKTAALTFLSKLRRMTNPLFPFSTPNVYPAFMRCARQFRNLKSRLRAGLAHEPDRVRAPGDLGLFCATCPQIGKNVTVAEVEASGQPQVLKLYRPQVTADGNFKLDNLKMRNPNDDVRLSDGEMFCVGSVAYNEHLRITPERKQRSTCNNHRAVNETNAKHKEVDSTGIGACACARHGCFYPHSVVGFKVGERQVNMDYAISEVFRQLPDQIKEFLLIYDISCQWVLHWMERFQKGDYLFYREDLKLLPAVGKFHLGAHVLECFWEFSLNFMEGTGQVDGEILETLWASLDKVVGSTRSMSRAHRQEVLDDYMNDSNWKKMCGAVNALIGKMDRASEGLDLTKAAFQELSGRVGADFIQRWEEEERNALRPRGIGRRIYKTETAKEPGLAEMCLRLTTEEKREKGQLSGSVALITGGLNIERAQNNLKRYTASLGKRPTTAQKRDLIAKQDSLQKRQAKFEKSMLSFIRKHRLNRGHYDTGSEDDDANKSTMVELSDSDSEEDGWEEDNMEEADASTTVQVEKMQLSLPSNLTRVHLSDTLRTTLQRQEATMREGQINDSLRKLRLALGSKAWMLRNNVRDASGGKARTRAWDGVKAKGLEVRRHVQVYSQAAAALHRMGMGAQWKPITKQDLAMPGDIVEANRTGQRSSTLPWFWRLEDGGAMEEMQESGEMYEFYRVNWLRAKARVTRWEEEKDFVGHEMQWTVNSFKHLRHEWTERSRKAGDEKPGLQAYAEKQVAMWEEFLGNAEAMFQWAKTTSKQDRKRKKGPA